MPERLHTDRKLIGTKQVLKALKAGRVAAVYVADDADPMLREPLVGQCRDAGVEVIPVATMKELGKLCQIHVGAEKQISSVPTEYLRYFGIKYMLHSSNNPRKEEQHAYF